MANTSNPFDFSEFRAPSGRDGLEPNSAQVAHHGFPSGTHQESTFDPFAEALPLPSFDDGGAVAPSFDAFGRSESRAAGPSFDEVASPPVLWCSLAGLAAIAAIALGVFGLNHLLLAWTAWALAGPVAIGLLAVHSMSDTKQRAKPFYSQPGWTVPVYWTVMAFAFVGVCLSAWSIADWVGRL